MRIQVLVFFRKAGQVRSEGKSWGLREEKIVRGHINPSTCEWPGRMKCSAQYSGSRSAVRH